MNGYIVKGIGGFYYVKTPDGIVECKPRGIFRKQKITPVAGDEVTLETENGASVIAQIAPRKNVFVRPPVANLDVLFLVASTTQPTPSTLVLDKLSAIAVDKGVQPVIVCTKSDLAEAEFLRSAYEKSTLPFIRIDYSSGAGLDEVKQWISGRLCAFCGNSGVGKSTLLNILGGIDRADSGDILIDGERMADMNEKALTLYRRRHLGYIFQMYNLIPNLTVRENIEVGAYLSRRPLDVDDLLHLLGLWDHRGKLPNQLSGGQQQRTSIGRAIVKNPDILLCDEPTGALDYKTSKEILKLIETVNQKYGNTVIMVTHNDAIRLMADRVVRLRDGAIRSNETNAVKVPAQDLEW